MDVSTTTDAVRRPGRGRIFDSIVEAIGDTPIVRLRQLPQQHGSVASILIKLESAGKTIVAIVPSFSERYLSTALFEGI
jgi:cysteine synthase